MNLKIETFTPSPAENWMYQQKLQGKNTIANWELRCSDAGTRWILQK